MIIALASHRTNPSDYSNEFIPTPAFLDPTTSAGDDYANS